MSTTGPVHVSLEGLSSSEDMICRALRDPASRGLCARVYGGALAISPASGTILQRRREAVDRKLELGQKMASIIQPGQFVFIDAGSTNLAVARLLPKSIGLTAATHDPTIAAVLTERTNLTLITIGGKSTRSWAPRWMAGGPSGFGASPRSSLVGNMR